jgi:hypothetical protein
LRSTIQQVDDFFAVYRPHGKPVHTVHCLILASDLPAEWTAFNYSARVEQVVEKPCIACTFVFVFHADRVLADVIK